MAYSVHGHISYILEVNSKRSIWEKKKRNRKQSSAEEIDCVDSFFSFLTKIFHIYYSPLYFQNNDNLRYCLHSIPKVSNKTKF